MALSLLWTLGNVIEGIANFKAVSVFFIMISLMWQCININVQEYLFFVKWGPLYLEQKYLLKPRKSSANDGQCTGLICLVLPVRPRARQCARNGPWPCSLCMDMVTQMPICPWGLQSADLGFISLGKHGNVCMQQPSSVSRKCLGILVYRISSSWR